MAKVLVLYYSMYGHIETMANTVAEGARSVPDTEVTLKRVPETIPEEKAKAYGAKLNQAAQVATPNELGDYDAITSDFLRGSDGFFGTFEIQTNGNPDVFAKKFF